jgi:hypothetical protein
MDSHIEAIRLAIQAGASDEARQGGIRACRAILAALEATSPEAPTPPDASAARPTEPAATPPPMPDMPPAAAPPVMPDVAAVVGALRGMPPEQLLDLAIARLRAALPPGSTMPAAAPVRFHLIPVQHLSKPK